jgi:hypothetical protein
MTDQELLEVFKTLFEYFVVNDKDILNFIMVRSRKSHLISMLSAASLCRYIEREKSLSYTDDYCIEFE